MALVKDDVEKPNLGEPIDICSGLFVRGDDYIQLTLINFLLNRVAWLIVINFSFNSSMSEEFLNLHLPLISKWIGTNYQISWSLPICSLLDSWLIEHNSQALNGLTQTHVITEGAVETVSSEFGHPQDSLLLIIPEFGIRFDYELVFFRAHVVLGENVHKVLTISETITTFLLK